MKFYDLGGQGWVSRVHDAKINVAQTAALISIAISLNKIAEDDR